MPLQGQQLADNALACANAYSKFNEPMAKGSSNMDVEKGRGWSRSVIEVHGVLYASGAIGLLSPQEQQFVNKALERAHLMDG